MTANGIIFKLKTGCREIRHPFAWFNCGFECRKCGEAFNSPLAFVHHGEANSCIRMPIPSNYTDQESAVDGENAFCIYLIELATELCQQPEQKSDECDANNAKELLKQTDIPAVIKLQIQLLFEFFSLFVSKDDPARVPIDHICAMLRECGFTPSINDARELSMWCDDGTNSLVSFDEFIEFWVRCLVVHPDNVDCNASPVGRITHREIGIVLPRMIGHSATKRCCDLIRSDVKTTEFLAILTKAMATDVGQANQHNGLPAHYVFFLLHHHNLKLIFNYNEDAETNLIITLYHELGDPILHLELFSHYTISKVFSKF